MKAPEKLYISNIEKRFSEKCHSASIVKYCDDDIEYTHTDAFIEKACEYMRSHIDQQLTIYHEQTWKKRDEFIEDFRKYMEE